MTGEVEALARTLGREAARGAGGIGAIHAAIAGRVFTAVGPSATPARVTHDAIAGVAYAAVARFAALAGLVAGAALPARELSTTRRGAIALGVLTGLSGDELEAEGSALQAPMALRVGGRVARVPEDFPGATGRLVVFLHGLFETEHAWTAASEGYGARLARDLEATPLYVRFNSGRHISSNGRDLAALLDAAVAAWPVPVGSIALVGHSMGGLVARSACHHGGAFTAHVRHVVSLGTPHAGAPLAQGIHHAAHALHALPETRPFARLLRRRSAGIRDLRSAALVDADWDGRDPDALRAVACAEVPLLEGATHCFVAATVTRDRDHPVGRLIGDWLVLAPSASGRGRVRFEDANGLHVGGAHHLALLDHPAVYAKLREWLAA
ncbi:MAG: alpha/beta hydrolase [Solirubrobacteraceae bacterium]